MMTENAKNHVLNLTGYQAAVVMGYSYSRLQQLLASDDPPPRNPDKTFPSDQLGEWIRRRAIQSVTGTGKVGRPPGQRNDEELPEGILSPVQERARKDKEMADKTALENAVRRAELVEAATVRKKWQEVVLLIRSKMMRIPFAAAPLVVGQTDFFKVQKILDDQIRDVLTELSAGQE